MIEDSSPVNSSLLAHRKIETHPLSGRFNQGERDVAKLLVNNPNLLQHLALFLEPMGLTQKALATHIGIPVQRINEIIRGKHCLNIL